MPHAVFDGGLFVGFQRPFVLFRSGVFTAVDPIGHGVFRTVKRCAAQRSGCFFIGCSRTLHRLFHPCGAKVRDRGEKQAEQGQTPVIKEEHDPIADHYHAGVENLGGELPHSFHAVIYVGYGLGHQFSGALLL